MNDRGSARARPESARPESTVIWERAARSFDAWRSQTPGAMDELVHTMTPVLWHVVRAYGLDHNRAQDVVQTTWLTLVQRSGSIADPTAIAAWLTTTARREAWRVSKHAGTTVPVTDEVLEYVAGDVRSAEDAAVERDEDRRLWACVSTLSARCQRLLRIVAFDERPDYAGIARELDIAVGSIGPTRGRCLAKLRDALGGAR